MDAEQTAFLLDLLISKVVSQSGINDPVDFILHYRLDDFTANAVMDEVSKIADEVRRGNNVTGLNALERIGRFHRTGMGAPLEFVSSAFKVWSPETWDKIKDIT
jgi:hypothetical protein